MKKSKCKSYNSWRKVKNNSESERLFLITTTGKPFAYLSTRIGAIFPNPGLGVQSFSLKVSATLFYRPPFYSDCFSTLIFTAKRQHRTVINELKDKLINDSCSQRDLNLTRINCQNPVPPGNDCDVMVMLGKISTAKYTALLLLYNYKRQK